MVIDTRESTIGSSESLRALVIGAGPSGLVTAKYLLESTDPIYHVTILDQQERNDANNNDSIGIGGTFINKVYDGTRLVSSKYITAFSDFRMVRLPSSSPSEDDQNISSPAPRTIKTAVCKVQSYREVDENECQSVTSSSASDSDSAIMDESKITPSKTMESNAYPIDHTNHPSATDYVKYLEAYCEKFSITDCIKFGCKVISLKGKDNMIDATTLEADAKSTNHSVEPTMLDTNGYIVQYEVTQNDPNNNGKTVELITEHFDVVAVCSGLHNHPSIPENISSLRNSFHGTIIHSSQYREASIFSNKKVLVLGSGETAMDISLRAIRNESCKSVALNVRRGFLSIPHNLTEDRPLDVFITNLFEHSYEHHWVHKLRLRWVLSTIVIRLFLWLTGSSVGFNQWACETTPVRRGYHIINKSHEAMSHLNVPIKSKTWYGRFWMWVYGETNLKPIQSFHQTSVIDIQSDGKTVVFDDGRTYEADIIVLATGYKQSFPFLDDSIQEEHRKESNQTSSISSISKFILDEEALPSQHFITNPRRPRLGFIGFVRPNVGAIPPMSELQVMWWLCQMRGKVQMLQQSSNNPPTYMVLGGKYSYGVDYGNYMHRVAEDIGAAPTLSNLLLLTMRSSSHYNHHSPFKILFTYCMGQSHIPLFRLMGPYESKVCWEVMHELYDVCVNRGPLENFGLIAVCWISLWMNVASCILEIIWCMLTMKRPRLFGRY